MGRLADRLSGVRVRASAPGADIDAELRDRTSITMSFGESVYEFIGKEALERALAALARSLWAGWQRQYLAAIDETDLNIEANDQHDLNFFAERDTVQAAGTSADGRITITVTGMRNFAVRITPGTTREISEDAFSAGAAQAATRLIHDYTAKVNELKKRYYG